MNELIEMINSLEDSWNRIQESWNDEQKMEEIPEERRCWSELITEEEKAKNAWIMSTESD